MHPLRIVFAIAVSCALLTAQSSYQNDFRGELLSDRPFIGNDYVAELYSSASHTVVATTMIATSGSFAFHGIPPGQYTLRINNMYGQTITSTMVDSSGMQGPMEIRLPENRQPKPVSGTISANELRHRVPKKAFQAMVAAQKCSEAGDFVTAVEKLKKAVQIDPDYSDAHNNLGAQYVRLGRYEPAAGEFEQALKLSPGSSLIHSNLAAALMGLRRVAEAETVARRALTLDPQNVHADYILGKILMLRPQTCPEAIQHLLRAATEIPSARLAVAQLEAMMRR